MEPGENDNVYAVYIIFTKNIISETEMVDKLLMHVQENSDLLYCRSCFDRENNQLNRFICCLNKKFYNHLVENCDFKRDSDFNITKYKVNNNPLSVGTTYGFFIKCNDDEKNKIIDIFNKFESYGFIRSGTYKINEPNPYPNGISRGYIIVSFSKQNDKYPRQYIRKLKDLLNSSNIGGSNINIKWASNSVLKDIFSSENKDKKPVRQ
jgi:hypothetical protein